jgi:hypothetical protein
MNPNNPLQGYINSTLEIQESYIEKDNKEIIEQANVMNPDKESEEKKKKAVENDDTDLAHSSWFKKQKKKNKRNLVF